ncbi:MAG: N-acetylmuramoyl-L-alanine amidase [Ruminococcus sp.]|nr:N-acetylmuramoyl-L-alanine amidase [Ruminococcus sp.]
MTICRGIAGRRGENPVGIFLHNDAGSQNADAAFYRSWLQTHSLENGFAHYYVASDSVLQAEDDTNCAWHCGDPNGNLNYLSIEVCQSMGELNTFKSNEKTALELAAQKCQQYGITPSKDTIRLHQEVYATACPHRSTEIHGGASAAKMYFINRIKELMNEINSTGTAERLATTAIERTITTMQCFYKITDKDKNKIYYFDGFNVHPLSHPDEKKVLNDIYKANNGKDMPEFSWISKVPWFMRLKNAMKRMD